MKRTLIIIAFVFIFFDAKAQISLDTLLTYSGNFSPAVMSIDSSGNIVIGGSSGLQPSMAKIIPDSGLAFVYQYTTVFDNQKNHISAITFDKFDNIYTHLYAEFNHSWVEKFSKRGDPLAKYDTLNCTSLLGDGNVKYGNISVLKSGNVQLVTQSKNDELVRYIFDSSLQNLVSTDTFLFNSDIYCCFNSLSTTQSEVLMPGKVNNQQGFFKLDAQLKFTPFDGFEFEDSKFIAFSKSENFVYAYNNNYKNVGSDTLFSYNPELCLFDNDFGLYKDKRPFQSVIDSPGVVIRPIIRDALNHESFGIIVVGQFTTGISSPRGVKEFIAQIDPNTLEIVDIWINDSARIFWHVKSFENRIFALDSPIGFPSGFNLVEIAFNEITSVKNVKATYESLEFYPNPTKDILTIKAAKELNGQNYSIYSSLGQIVQRGTIQHQINVATLPKGFYILIIENEQRSIFIKE